MTANTNAESNIRNTNADTESNVCTNTESNVCTDAESNVRTNAESGNNGESKEDGHIKDLPRHYENIHDADITAKVTSLVSLLNEKILGVNLINVIQLNYSKDPTFAKILEAPKSHKNFVVQNGLIYLKEEGDQEVLGVPDHVIIDGRNLREIIISEAHSLLAHLGTSKTCAYLRDHIWWKSINQDVQSFCDLCEVCKRSKPNNQCAYGPLKTLNVPTYPWESIGIDFIGPLPESKNRNGSFNTIAVIIDLLTGMVHLVPCRTYYKATQVAELIFAEVYKHHGLPKNIISDRDILSTSHFWQELHRLIGINLRMSSAYHPQSDGSTEHANRTVTQMIQTCIATNQKDWVLRLPGIEFAINLAKSESTGFSPFFLNSGQTPCALIWNNDTDKRYVGVQKFTFNMKTAVMSAHNSILAARVKQTRDVNRRRREVPFTEGDLVYLSTVNLLLPKGLARKLSPKFIGPYKITKDF